MKYLSTRIPRSKGYYSPFTTMNTKSSRQITAHPFSRAQDSESLNWSIPDLTTSQIRNIFLGVTSHEHPILIQQAGLALSQHTWASLATSAPAAPIGCTGFSCAHRFIHWQLFPPNSQLLFLACYLWIRITGKSAVSPDTANLAQLCLELLKQQQNSAHIPEAVKENNSKVYLLFKK